MESHRIKEVPRDEAVDPDAGLTIAEMKARDRFAEESIKAAKPAREAGRLTGYEITTEQASGLFLNRGRCGDSLDAIDPKPGSTIRVYPGVIGSFHGVDIDGVEAFWLTPMERDAERAKWLADYDRKRREEFVEQREKLDADFDSLPEALKARIQLFRDEDPGFRIDSESYEMFACVEAAKFWRAAVQAAEAMSNRKAVERFWTDDELRNKANYNGSVQGTVWEVEPDSYAERWLLWAWALNSDSYDYAYKRQSKILGSDGGHSGNTFGGAMSLALRLLRGEPT